MNDFPVAMSLAAAAALFILFLKLNIRRVLGFDPWVDIASTIFLVSIFSGTATGAAAAMFAGVFLSLMLYIARGLFGCEKLVRNGWQFRWKYHPPKWRGR